MKPKSIGLGFQLDAHLVWRACEFIFNEPEFSEYEPLLPLLFELSAAVAELPCRFLKTEINQDKRAEDEVLIRCLRNFSKPTLALAHHLTQYVDGMSVISYTLLRHRTIPRTRVPPKREFETDDADDQDIADFINDKFKPKREVLAGAVKKARYSLAEVQWECFDACIWAALTALGIKTTPSSRETCCRPERGIMDYGTYFLLSPDKTCLKWVDHFIKSHRLKEDLLIWPDITMHFTRSEVRQCTANSQAAGVVVPEDSNLFAYPARKARFSSPRFDFTKQLFERPGVNWTNCVFLTPQCEDEVKRNSKDTPERSVSSGGTIDIASRMVKRYVRIGHL